MDPKQYGSSKLLMICDHPGASGSEEGSSSRIGTSKAEKVNNPPINRILY